MMRKILIEFKSKISKSFPKFLLSPNHNDFLENSKELSFLE